jgi:predicted N-acetyltransferase YhbS
MSRQTAPIDLRLRRPTPDDAEAIYDLTAKAFSRGHKYWDWLDYCRRCYVEGSHYDWDASTIGEIDGRVVTHWGVWDYTMRLDAARLRVAGIGAVATDGAFYRRGLMRRTVEGALPVIARAGYDLSTLYGLWDFYDKFGYTRGWSEPTYRVHLDDLPEHAPGTRTGKLTRKDVGEMDTLYNRQASREALAGSACRPTFGPGRLGDWRGIGWRDKAGQLAGYVLYASDDRQVRVVEAVGDVETCLRVIARDARKLNREPVVFQSIHEDSALARRLRAGTVHIETQLVRAGGPMVRTMDLAATLGKLAETIARRLAQSRFAAWRGTVILTDGRQSAAWVIDQAGVRVEPDPPPGRCKHAICGGDAVARLLIGTADPMETCREHGIRLTGDAADLVAVLLPARAPTLSEWDHF